MKHYTKALLSAALISSSLVSGVAFAEGSTKGAVVDRNGNFVRSALSGECVRTKWEVGSDECAPKQIAEAPRYVAPASPEPQKMTTKEYNRAYLVFFNFNKYTLTDSAKRIIGDLFGDTKKANKSSFALTGYTDRSGPDAYNMELSRKRAMAVKDELVKLGAYSGNITVSWKGESDPLVPTKDGIKEPQNRRTAIKVTTETNE